jgi:hypothetical protein
MRKLTLKEKLKKISLQKKQEIIKFFAEDAETKAISSNAFRKIYNNLIKNKD